MYPGSYDLSAKLIEHVIESQSVTIFGGEQKQLALQGERVAFSLYGKISTINEDH